MSSSRDHHSRCPPRGDDTCRSTNDNRKADIPTKDQEKKTRGDRRIDSDNESSSSRLSASRDERRSRRSRGRDRTSSHSRRKRCSSSSRSSSSDSRSRDDGSSSSHRRRGRRRDGRKERRSKSHRRRKKRRKKSLIRRRDKDRQREKKKKSRGKKKRRGSDDSSESGTTSSASADEENGDSLGRTIHAKRIQVAETSKYTATSPTPSAKEKAPPLSAHAPKTEEASAERTKEEAAGAAASRSMVPMSREEYEAQSLVIREVFDPDTGRTRLVRGDGEIIERIVSREDHARINRMATAGDGRSFSRGVSAAAAAAFSSEGRRGAHR